MTKKCSIWWCDNKHYALGFCKPHWAGIKRFGHPYGKHHKQLSKVDAEILKARLIAIKLTEFAQTEFEPTEFAPKYTWETHEKTVTCKYCKRTDNTHAPLCIMNLCKTLLENTAGFPNAYVPSGSEMIDEFIKQVKQGEIK